MKFKPNATLLAGILLAVATSATAQDRPSWRTDAPKRPDAPPEMEMEEPEMQFQINREDLFSDDMVDVDEEPAPVDEPAPAMEQPVETTPAPAQEEVATVVDTQPEPAPIEMPVDTAPAQPETVIEEPVIEEPAQQPVVEQATIEQPAVETESSERIASLQPPATEPAPVDEIREEATEPVSSFRLKRTKAVAPQYPRHAWLNEEEGWVDLRLTVNPAGKVTKVDIVAAEPKRVFEKSAVRAAMRWQFEPPSAAGLTEPQTGVFRITFTMDG